MRIGLSVDEIQWLAGEIQSARHEIRKIAVQMHSDMANDEELQNDYWLAQSRFSHFRKFYEFENPSFLEALRCGENDAIEDAIVFLSADPYCFRSGYIKKKLCHLLTQCVLTPRQRLLLREIVINSVTAHRPVSFREFVELGCALYTSGFYARVRNLKIIPFSYAIKRKRILLAAMERAGVAWKKKQEMLAAETP